VPLFDDPDRPFKQAAFSECIHGRTRGISMRTDRYRFTLWETMDEASRRRGVELYDHRSDPQENHNLAGRPEHRELVAELTRQLRAGWPAALPGSLEAGR
jgi:hypothetical protein